MAIFSNQGNVQTIAFKRRLGYNGMSVRVEVTKDAELDKIGKKIAEYFVLQGSMNVQLRKDGGKYYVFEINPRLSSTIAFRYRLGFKDDIWWLKSLDKEEDFRIEFSLPEEPIVGIRTLGERIFIGDEVKIGSCNEPM